MLDKTAIFIATWFYSGYIRPASGTWGTLAAIPVILPVITFWGLWGIIFGSLILFTIGLWAAHRFEIITGEHDSSRIVIDEACGMLIACIPLLYSLNWQTVVVCFMVFRVFDAWKIGLVGWCDRNVSGAFGVMIDDIVAGLMTAITVMLGLWLWF